MALGPFITYVPPGVYTRTLTEANVANLVAGLRIPAFIGVGQEELEQRDLEVVRGSSATVDQQILNEDAALSWVVDNTNPQNLVLGAQDGTRTQLRVRNFPIVDGQGFGRVTNDVRSVTVTVNGTPQAIGSVQGNLGLITLQVPTQPDDVVRVTYFFHRGDTAFSDDVSEQVTPTNATLTTPAFAPFNVVVGTNDVFVLEVNGTSYSMTLAAGSLTAAGLKAQIDSNAVPNLATSVFTDNNGQDHLRLTTPISLVVGEGNANGALGFTAGDSSQRNADFRVFNRPIVDGSSGGLTTTDTSKVVVKVDGVQVVAAAVDGTNGVVTLPYAPAPGSSVTVDYWANTWQDTFDYLPNSLVTTVTKAGISPGRNDYIQGQDFVVSNPSPDVSIVHWGTSFVVASGTTTAGAEPMDESQIVGTLVDSKLFMAECSPVVNNTTIPATVSTTKFLLPEIPTMGNGRDTVLGSSLYNSVSNGRQALTTNRPDLIVVRVGRNIRDAMNRAPVKVLTVDGVNREITLKSALPPDYKAFATFYYNRIQDDTYLLKCTIPGAVGVGQYTAESSLTAQSLFQVLFGTKSGLGQTVQWPRGVETIPDAFHTGEGTPVSETVTVTFDLAAATNAAFTNPAAAPYSFYSPSSATWTTNVNGGNVVTNLAAAAPAYLVSGHVQPIQSGVDTGKIAIPASPGNELELEIDGETVSVVLTSGNQFPAAIVADINAAIDAHAAFIGTAPNNLASFVQIGGATGDVMFVIQSYSTPAALPGGFDAQSTVKIAQGSVESILGFTTFQMASGTSGAINKPATLLSANAETYNITAGLNDTFKLRMNGTDYEATLPAGAAVTAAAVVAAINGVAGLAGVASVGTLDNLGKVRLTSTINTTDSSLLILSGNANEVLGFTQGAQASQTQVSAQEVCNVLMDTAGYAAGAVAYPVSLNGSSYITFESLTTGAATSSIGFVDSANSAFNSTTKVGLVPGTSGDIGEDAYDKFTVTSSNVVGSAGEGIPGQTYTDARTGLRFTVLPSATGNYTATGYFTLTVSPTFKVNPAIPTYAFGGLETIVSNLVNVGVNDTGTIQTFNPGGVEPAIGDFYTISYRYLKQDFSTRIFQRLKTIEANFGRTSPENRVTLAAYLAILNGAVLVGIKQVLKVPNTSQASDQSFIDAIHELSTPLPGNIRPDIIVPLATSTAVYSFLTNHCEVQSSVRNQSERMGMIGFASGTSPLSAQTIAQSLLSSRIVALYPDSLVITLTDELNQSFESLSDGTAYAAMTAGAVVSPAVDVATPYTRRQLLGGTRIPRTLDPVEANQTAVKGITLLEDLDPIIRIRQGLTTNMQSILTRLPTVTQIADFVQQQSRQSLDAFVGTKFLAARTNEVVVSMTGLFKGLVQAEIVGAFTGLEATIDADDPTVMRFEGYYSPIFPLLYISMVFNLRARI